MPLSRKAIDSAKTALAITVAMGIALYLDWEQPRWAAITIALTAMATIGMSFNNAIERIFGTLTAGFMTLFLLGLFGQDRWLYLVALSAWMGLCTYLMGGKKLEGFWMMAGFATAILAIEAGIDAEASAETFWAVILRLKQTLLGILVYTVVFVLLWPRDGYAAFKAISSALASTQQQLFGLYGELIRGGLDDADKIQSAQKLRMQLVQQQNQFALLLEGAEKERYEVWETRHEWESFQEQLEAFNETMAYWRESFTEVKALDTDALLPNLAEFENEVDGRLTQIGRMLADNAPTQTPLDIELAPNLEAIGKLSPFQKAAYTVFFNRLQSLGPLTRSMFQTLGDIKGHTPAVGPVAEKSPSPFMIVPDLDRLLGSLRVILTLWIAYLALIYFNPIPGGGELVAMAAASGMAVSLLPYLPIKMFMPALTGFIIFTAVIYIFLMPHLTTYAELGLLVFVVSFGIIYVYFEPQKALFKGLGIVLFLTLLHIEPEQHYDFVIFLDTSIMFYLIALSLVITAYIPFSARPERAYLRLLGRFFRCSEYLISTLRKDPHHKPTLLESWKRAFYTKELKMVPAKLAIWSNFIDTKLLAGTSPEQIQALTIKLQVLTFRLLELLDARSEVHGQRLAQELDAEELRENIRAWQSSMQAAFQRLSSDPTAGDPKLFRAKLSEIVENLEVRVNEILEEKSQGLLSAQDNANIYRLLGAYRSLSEAMGDYLASTDVIHWSRWQEERF